MLCTICNQKATVQCCSFTFCGSHFTEHYLNRGMHNPVRLAINLPKIEESVLKKELTSRISSLNQVISELESLASLMITTISDLKNSQIQEIKLTIYLYQEILNTERLFDVEEVEKIIKTKLIVKSIIPDELIEEIKKIFQKNLLNFQDDDEKEMQ